MRQIKLWQKIALQMDHLIGHQALLRFIQTALRFLDPQGVDLSF